VKTEAQYVVGLKNGDYSAFDVLFKKYVKKLYAFVISITKDSFMAEEISQDVFARVWEKRARIDEHYSFQSFLFAVTYNETISHLRKTKAEKIKIESFTSYKNTSTNETEYEVEFRNLESITSTIIENFPDKRRQIFKMSREQGLTNKEIAQVLGISVKTVENQMTVALKKLREELGRNELFGLFFYFISVASG
jgi:RNA polymerase sigma-70 factor (ECF subfamily)